MLECWLPQNGQMIVTNITITPKADPLGNQGIIIGRHHHQLKVCKFQDSAIDLKGLAVVLLQDLPSSKTWEDSFLLWSLLLLVQVALSSCWYQWCKWRPLSLLLLVQVAHPKFSARALHIKTSKYAHHHNHYCRQWKSWITTQCNHFTFSKGITIARQSGLYLTGNSKILANILDIAYKLHTKPPSKNKASWLIYC